MVTTKIVPSKPALLLEGIKRELIITDLHIGFESNLASNKIFVGKNTSIEETITEVKNLIKTTKSESLILLGDVKSSIRNISKNEWNEVPRFFENVCKLADVILVPGNHDANISRLIPDNVSLSSSIGTGIDNTLLTHGHVNPSEKFAYVDRIVMGHVHPVFFDESSVLNGQRVWVSLQMDKSKVFPSHSGSLEIIVVPSFNRYFYATYKQNYQRSISPIIEKVKDFCRAKIVTLEGDIIGDENSLYKVL